LNSKTIEVGQLKKKKKKKTRPLADSNSEGRTGLKAIVASDEHLPMVAGHLVRSRCTTNQPIGGFNHQSGGCGFIPSASGKKQEDWPPADMCLKSGKLNQLQIIFLFPNDRECPLNKRFWVRIDFHKSTRRWSPYVRA
jgi:hypothetical protein